MANKIDLVFCEECKKENKTPTIKSAGRCSTCMGFLPFYDENGKMHVHNPNTSTEYLVCSNGHKWTREIKEECWCGWPNIKDKNGN